MSDMALPAPIHRWSWLIVMIVGLAVGLFGQTLYLTGLISGWRADTDASLRDYSRRLGELERSDREANNLPGRIDQHQDRLARLEQRDIEVQHIDRQTVQELTRLAGSVHNISVQMVQIGQDVRELRTNRRATGSISPHYPAPLLAPSAPANERPGDKAPGFRP